MSGSTGINQFTASYSINATYLTFGPMALTRRAGPPELSAQEAAIVGALAGACSYRLEGGRLLVEGPSGALELTSVDSAAGARRSGERSSALRWLGRDGRPARRSSSSRCAASRSTQPLLDVFGRAVEQFAFRGASGRDIVLFGLAVTFLPTAVLWASEALVELVAGERLRSRVHLALLMALVVVFVLQAARPLARGLPLLLGAMAVAVAAAWAYRRFPVVKLWLAFTALAPLVFLALFLTSSSTSRLLEPQASAAPAEVGAPAPVVMVVLDELPMASLLDADGGIDRELFPNLAALADESHWYRNATTVSTSTWHAVPALVTGRLPEEDDSLPISDSHPDSLFSLLGSTYDLHVTETNTRLCPPAACPYEGSSGEVWSGLARDLRGVLRDRLSPSRQADDPVDRVRRADRPAGRLDLRLPRRHPARAVPVPDGQPRRRSRGAAGAVLPAHAPPARALPVPAHGQRLPTP